jgi:hypothetical protein
MSEQKKTTQRVTYGQQVLDHWAQKHTDDDDVIEYRRKMEPEILKNIHETAERSSKIEPYCGKDFYIVLAMKTERVGGVPRTWVFARQSCPTPTYQQSVWKCHHQTGALEYLWCIPDQVLYWHVIHNAHKYINDAETAGMAKFCLLMESNELIEWVIKENGEKPDGVIQYKTESPIIT